MCCDDGTLPPDAAVLQWRVLMIEAFAKIGQKIPSAEDFAGFLKEAGFEDVRVELLKRPSNDWPKDGRLKELGRVSFDELS
jgi:hypothetical protein